MLSPTPGVVVGGRYLLVRRLAKGGMGAVWIARHRELDVDVAVKFMAPSLLANVDLRARFEREAKVVARLNSRHIVKVLDYGVDDDIPYLCMELLRGESLADRLAREGRLSVSAVNKILQEICKALRIAHGEGLVHRDLKPGNIFLVIEDHEEVVKVLDFGIVKDTRAGESKEAKLETETGLAMGSVHYMSPEQIRSSRSVDARSDLWSVAIILYKVLTGNLPFSGMARGDVMVRVCTDPLVPPSFVVPGLPKEIDAFFARALTRDPAERYQSAEEFSNAFVAVASLVAGAEMPPGGWKKTIKLAGPMPLISERPASIKRGAAVRTQPFPQSHPEAHHTKVPPVVSAVLEKTAGAFQSVKMPRVTASALRSDAVLPTTPSSRVPRALVMVMVLLAFGGAGIVGVVALNRGAASKDSTSVVANSAVASGSAIDVVAPPPAKEIQAAVVPVGSVALTVLVPSCSSAVPKAPAAIAPNPFKGVKPISSSTVTVAPRASRRNPLDDAN